MTHAQGPSEDLTAERHQLAQRTARIGRTRERHWRDARKSWLKKKGPQQIPLRVPVRREKAKAKHHEPSPQSRRTSESCSCREEVTRTIFPTSRRSLSRATGHARLYVPPGSERACTRVVFYSLPVRVCHRFRRRLADRWNTRLLGTRSASILSVDAGDLRRPGGQLWKDSKI